MGYLEPAEESLLFVESVRVLLRNSLVVLLVAAVLVVFGALLLPQMLQLAKRLERFATLKANLYRRLRVNEARNMMCKLS